MNYLIQYLNINLSNYLWELIVLIPPCSVLILVWSMGIKRSGASSTSKNPTSIGLFNYIKPSKNMVIPTGLG